MSNRTATVTYSNFARAESERMFTGIAASAGASNVWNHFRVPTPLDQQTVIRMNRDTLYSAAIIDVTDGATITIPEVGGRYVSVMLVNQDHYINRVLHEAGTYELTAEELGSDFVCAAARILVNSEDPADVAEVNRLQDQFQLHSTGQRQFVAAEVDEASFTETREAVLTLAKGLTSLERSFGRREEVGAIEHLLGAAAGWGGLPASEASYENVDPRLPVGEYTLTVADVPVDGFWSISMYNGAGFFEPNEWDAYSVNSVTGVRDADGSITVRFGGDPAAPNFLPLPDGWNYLVRLYRPRPEVLDGTWQFPQLAEQ
ncbi:DUF1214 domain-containing protein [Leucobacter chromiireducens]|uniref:DUF1214 domain-containing protein n=1 Tax=Leucobacter chromiireducens TaxID=283877 RepID=UPI001F153FD7|nr:DUF1214 domain-containing protein [Leucobacter chromiireducens]